MSIYLKDFVSDPNNPKANAKLRGYAAIYGTKSQSVFDHGLHEVLAPGCFTSYLASGRSPNLIFNHLGVDGFMTSNVTLWSDSIGLAFEADQIRYNDKNARVVDMIARGIIRGCSFKATWAKEGRNVELVDDGTEMHVVRAVESLTEIGPVEGPAYQETGIWLSTANIQWLPGNLYSLALKWERGRL